MNWFRRHPTIVVGPLVGMLVLSVLCVSGPYSLFVGVTRSGDNERPRSAIVFLAMILWLFAVGLVFGFYRDPIFGDRYLTGLLAWTGSAILAAVVGLYRAYSGAADRLNRSVFATREE